MSGGYMRFGPPQIRRLPLPRASDNSIQVIVEKVHELIAATQDPTGDPARAAALEHEIDAAVADLFGINQ